MQTAAAPLASRADLMRRLQVGATLTMTGHDWFPESFLLGQARKVVKTCTTHVYLHTERPDGETVESRLDLPRAEDIDFTGPDTFRVRLDDSGLAWMSYQLGSA